MSCCMAWRVEDRAAADRAVAAAEGADADAVVFVWCHERGGAVVHVVFVSGSPEACAAADEVLAGCPVLDPWACCDDVGRARCEYPASAPMSRVSGEVSRLAGEAEAAVLSPPRAAGSGTLDELLRQRAVRRFRDGRRCE